MSGAELLMAAAVVSAVGSMQQGQAAKSQAEFDAQVREGDAAIAGAQAAQNARKTRRDGSARQATARVQLAGSGARLEGTPLDLLGQLAADTELSALEDVQAGDVAATRNLTRAKATRARGVAAQRQSMFNAGSSLLRGFS